MLPPAIGALSSLIRDDSALVARVRRECYYTWHTSSHLHPRDTMRRAHKRGRQCVCVQHNAERESDRRQTPVNRQFQVGDNAVYPAHGVAQITGIESRDIAGQKKEFYILKILETDMKLMIPTDGAQRAGLRDVISRRCKKVLEILKDPRSRSRFSRGTSAIASTPRC